MHPQYTHWSGLSSCLNPTPVAVCLSGLLTMTLTFFSLQMTDGGSVSLENSDWYKKIRYREEFHLVHSLPGPIAMKQAEAEICRELRKELGVPVEEIPGTLYY